MAEICFCRLNFFVRVRTRSLSKRFKSLCLRNCGCLSSVTNFVHIKANDWLLKLGWNFFFTRETFWHCKPFLIGLFPFATLFPGQISLFNNNFAKLWCAFVCRVKNFSHNKRRIWLLGVWKRIEMGFGCGQFQAGNFWKVVFCLMCFSGVCQCFSICNFDNSSFQLVSDFTGSILDFSAAHPSFTFSPSLNSWFWIELSFEDFEIRDSITNAQRNSWSIKDSNFTIICANYSTSSNSSNNATGSSTYSGQSNQTKNYTSDWISFSTTLQTSTGNSTISFLFQTFEQNVTASLNSINDTLVFSNGSFASITTISTNDPFWNGAFPVLHLKLVTSASSESLSTYAYYPDGNLQNVYLSATPTSNLGLLTADNALINVTTCSNIVNNATCRNCLFNCTKSDFTYQNISQSSQIESIWTTPLTVYIGVSFPTIYNTNLTMTSLTYTVIGQNALPISSIDWTALIVGFSIGICFCIILIVAFVIIYKKAPYLRQTKKKEDEQVKRTSIKLDQTTKGVTLED